MRITKDNGLRRLALVAVACGTIAAGCAGDGARAGAGASRHGSVEFVLDDFHDAASKADGARYFAHFAPEGVFLGTDATERWTVEEFRAYAERRFATGRGWTYSVLERHVGYSPRGDAAWFDERLHNERYGECRGSGALRRIDGRWRITQYNLTVPIPNDLLPTVAEMIREFDARR